MFHLGFRLWVRNCSIAEMEAVNLTGTSNVLVGNPGQVVLASSAAVYGAWPDNPLPMDEEHPPRPNPECAYAVQKLAVERMVEDAAPAVILRVSAVLGEHADANVMRMAKGYRWVVPKVRGAGQALQFLDESDAVGAFVAAGEAASSGASGVFNVATRDWLAAPDVRKIAGGRVAEMPRAVLMRGSELALKARLMPFGQERAVLLSGPMALDATLAGERLGWSARSASADVLARYVAGGRRQ